jgi:predicted lipoprotein with Yx(FWY)xxD motif
MRGTRGAGLSPLPALGVAIALLAACGEAAPTGSSDQTAALGVAEVSGVGSVLVDVEGFTLYELKTESSGEVQCTGECAEAWPPLIAPGGRAPAPPSGIVGTIGTVERPDGGLQVTFAGKPLYRFAGDSRPGQANGQGQGGVWFAVQPSGTDSPENPGDY